MGNFVLTISDADGDISYMDVYAQSKEEATASAIKSFNGQDYKVVDVYVGDRKQLECEGRDDPIHPDECR